jgi:hypothetical protein
MWKCFDIVRVHRNTTSYGRTLTIHLSWNSTGDEFFGCIKLWTCYVLVVWVNINTVNYYFKIWGMPVPWLTLRYYPSTFLERLRFITILLRGFGAMVCSSFNWIIMLRDSAWEETMYRGKAFSNTPTVTTESRRLVSARACYCPDKGMVRSDMSKPALIFFHCKSIHNKIQCQNFSC